MSWKCHIVLFIAVFACFTDCLLLWGYARVANTHHWLCLRGLMSESGILIVFRAPKSTLASSRNLCSTCSSLIGFLCNYITPTPTKWVLRNHFCEFFSFMETKTGFPLSLVWCYLTLTYLSNCWEGSKLTLYTGNIRSNKWKTVTDVSFFPFSFFRKVESLVHK